MKAIKQIILKEDIKSDKDVAVALLKSKNVNFIDASVVEGDDSIELEYVIDDEVRGFDCVYQLDLEEKLRYLLNIANAYEGILQTEFTADIKPENIYFDINALVKFTHKGIYKAVEPYENLKEEEFIRVYKAMIISTLDGKYEYSTLLNGKLEFYKGDLLCEKILHSREYKELTDILEEAYFKEKENNMLNYTKVSNKLVTGLRSSAVICSVLALIALISTAYLTLVYIPKIEAVSMSRLAFSKKSYSEVLNYSKKIDARSLKQEDKYIVAYSAVMTEALSDKQKESLLNNISESSNEAYLRYWILIGRADIDKALDIASFLDDPELLMYAMTRKIDELQRNPALGAEERTQQINEYKNKLEELKKKYLSVDESKKIDSEDK